MEITLEQISKMLEASRKLGMAKYSVELLDVEERFKDCLEVWLKIKGIEYRAILKDTTLADFFNDKTIKRIVGERLEKVLANN